MTKKCIYCKADILDESVVDFCESCGIGVWGKKMFGTIIRKMEEAREKNDLVPTNMIGVEDFKKKVSEF